MGWGLTERKAFKHFGEELIIICQQESGLKYWGGGGGGGLCPLQKNNHPLPMPMLLGHDPKKPLMSSYCDLSLCIHSICICGLMYSECKTQAIIKAHAKYWSTIRLDSTFEHDCIVHCLVYRS